MVIFVSKLRVKFKITGKYVKQSSKLIEDKIKYKKKESVNMLKSAGDIKREYSGYAKSLAKIYHAYLVGGDIKDFEKAVGIRNSKFTMLIADGEECGKALEKDFGTTNFTEVVQKARNTGFGEFEREIDRITKAIEKYFIYNEGYEELKNNGYLTPKGNLIEYVKKYGLSEEVTESEESEGSVELNEFKKLIAQLTEQFKKDFSQAKTPTERKESSYSRIYKALRVLRSYYNYTREGDLHYFAQEDGEDLVLILINKTPDFVLRAIFKENGKMSELRFSKKGIEKVDIKRLPNGSQMALETLRRA